MKHEARIIKSRPKITAALIADATGVRAKTAEFGAIGDVASTHSDHVLTYAKDRRYASAVNANRNISGVFCTEEIAPLIREGVETLICDDPNWAYCTLLDRVGKDVVWQPSVVNSRFADATIDPVGVYIGENVSIGPGSRILKGSYIEDNTTIRANAVLGGSGFQHQATSKGILSPEHDGFLIVESGAEIGPHAFISMGFCYRSTRIGRNTKLDTHVYVAHGAHIGAECIIGASAVILGHVVIGDHCHIGPNAALNNRIRVGDRATVSMGSVATKDVAPGQRVTGNFAVDHEIFLRNLKAAAAS